MSSPFSSTKTEDITSTLSLYTGTSVAVFGQIAIVGAPNKNMGPTLRGSAVVYERDDNGAGAYAANSWGRRSELVVTGSFASAGTDVCCEGFRCVAHWHIASYDP